MEILLQRYFEILQRNNHLLLPAPRIPVDIIRLIIDNMTNDVIAKSKEYYESVIPNQNISTFKSNFRLNLDTFIYVVDKISPNNLFLKRDRLLGGRDQVTPEKSLLIFLWTLGTPESYRAIGDRFDVGKSTVYACMKVVTEVILQELVFVIQWPTEDRKNRISENFSRYGLTNVIGAIDGCHIPIKKPNIDGEEYFNRKKFYSMVLQAVCTNDYKFTDCDIRWPGSVHDARVLRTSDLYPVAQELCGEQYYIIGDSAYPIKKWLITPYRNDGHLLPYQLYFNKIISKTRVVIENAFSLLKGRFRRLRDTLDKNVMEDIPKTIMVACILHNICIINGEEDIQNYIEEGRNQEIHIQMIRNDNDNNDNQGIQRRELLSQDIWNNRENF